MRKILKWLAIVLAGLLSLALTAVLVVYLLVGARLNRTYDVDPQPVAVARDVPREREGWPLVLVEMCSECHGQDLGGQIMDDDPLFGRLVASNLTAGQGGVGQVYSNKDFVRAIRHGVGADGKPLVVMPAQVFWPLSDEDLGIVIGYVRESPPVDRRLPPTVPGPLARIFVFLGMLEDAIPAEHIDHDAPRPPAPTPAVTAEYGEYLALVCQVCHLEDYAGGPGAGQGMNLTPGGELATWTEADFIRALRTGRTPDGDELDPEEMPWDILGKMTDEELTAIWLFLQTLPPVESPPETPEGG